MLYPNKYLLNPNHKIVVYLIGCGGTGSRVLVELSALNQNLVELGHLGFEIHVFDDDVVEQHNIGRQMFYQCDLGEYKSNVLATRINRSYGDNIQSHTTVCTGKHLKENPPGIIITCVDNVVFRRILDSHFSDTNRENVSSHFVPKIGLVGGSY